MLPPPQPRVYPDRRFERAGREAETKIDELVRRARRNPPIVRLWTNAWAEFVPFLAFDVEIRKVVCTTNAIESINARLRRAVNARRSQR